MTKKELKEAMDRNLGISNDSLDNSLNYLLRTPSRIVSFKKGDVIRISCKLCNTACFFCVFIDYTGCVKWKKKEQSIKIKHQSMRLCKPSGKCGWYPLTYPGISMAREILS